MADEKKKVKEEKVNSLLTVCEASQEMIEKAKNDGVSLVFDRAEAMKPCPIGAEGQLLSNLRDGSVPASGAQKES